VRGAETEITQRNEAAKATRVRPGWGNSNRASEGYAFAKDQVPFCEWSSQRTGREKSGKTGVRESSRCWSKEKNVWVQGTRSAMLEGPGGNVKNEEKKRGKRGERRICEWRLLRLSCGLGKKRIDRVILSRKTGGEKKEPRGGCPKKLEKMKKSQNSDAETQVVVAEGKETVNHIRLAPFGWERVKV